MLSTIALAGALATAPASAYDMSASAGTPYDRLAPPYGAIEGIAPSEEIGFVLDGDGQLEQHDGPEHALRAGQAFVRHAMDRSFVYRAGDESLDFLAFGANLAPAPVPKQGPLVVSLADAAEDVEDRGEFGWHERDLGGAIGSVLAGLRYATLPPGKLSTPPHWHSGEHELFVINEQHGVCSTELFAGKLRCFAQNSIFGRQIDAQRRSLPGLA